MKSVLRMEAKQQCSLWLSVRRKELRSLACLALRKESGRYNFNITRIGWSSSSLSLISLFKSIDTCFSRSRNCSVSYVDCWSNESNQSVLALVLTGRSIKTLFSTMFIFLGHFKTFVFNVRFLFKTRFSA